MWWSTNTANSERLNSVWSLWSWLPWDVTEGGVFPRRSCFPSFLRTEERGEDGCTPGSQPGPRSLFFPRCGFSCAGSDNSASWKNINCQIGNAEMKGTLSFTAGQDSELLWLSTRSNQKWQNYSCTFLISIPIYYKPGVIRPKMCFSCGQVLRPHCSKPLKNQNSW